MNTLKVNWKRWLLPACVLGFLWFTLINHLRVEWSVNPQYAYGWAVPFLCLYLIWGIAGERAEGGNLKPESGDGDQRAGGRGQRAGIRGWFHWLLWAFAIAWLPTRLIQEANPEWRLVSWALAIIVIGITLILLRRTESRGQRTGDKGQNSEVRGQRSEYTSETPKHRPTVAPFYCSSRYVFAICFFLVAVPWPTLLEGQLIQGLTRANAQATVESLGLLGVPAIQHGNVIELATGTVGLDEACSGIRSFQASLMIALFLGELYALDGLRRILCILTGFGLSFVFNVIRTTVLSMVAAKKGIAAIQGWHDPAGVTILVACFLCLWGMVVMAKGKGQTAEGGETVEQWDGKTVGGETVDGGTVDGETVEQWDGETVGGGQGAEVRDQRSEVREQGTDAEKRKAEILKHRHTDTLKHWTLPALACWFVFAEIGVEAWYRVREAKLPAALTWTIQLPTNAPSFHYVPISPKTKQFLRYDEGVNVGWTEPNAAEWQAIFLSWKPGSTAVQLAKNHTPEVCMTASGYKVTKEPELRLVSVGNIELPFRLYQVQGPGGVLYVYYCLWQDRGARREFDTELMTYGSRLGPVLAGIRNSGQRSIELAVAGIADESQAEAALKSQLEKLIKVER